jgi:tetratricopeptide (TPR) repeat protein
LNLLVLFCVAGCAVREYKLSGDIYIKTGEYEKALEQYKKWARKRKNDAEPYVALSVPYFIKNNYTESSVFLKKAFKTDKEAAKKAVLFYEKFLEVENYSWNIFYTGAKEFLKEEKLKVAESLIEEAEEVEDKKLKATSYILHGRISIRKKDINEALDYLNKAIKLDKNNAEAYAYLGKAYTDQNKTEKAISLLEKAVSKDPNNFLAHKLLGKSYLKQKKYNKAIETLEKASSMSANDSTVLYNLAHAYLEKEDYERASEVAEKTLGLPETTSENKAEAYIILGISNIHTEKYEEAIELLKEAIEAAPDKCDSYQLLADAYYKAKKVSLSKEFSRKWEKCVQK